MTHSTTVTICIRLALMTWHTISTGTEWNSWVLKPASDAAEEAIRMNPGIFSNKLAPRTRVNFAEPVGISQAKIENLCGDQVALDGYSWCGWVTWFAGS